MLFNTICQWLFLIPFCSCIWKTRILVLFSFDLHFACFSMCWRSLYMVSTDIVNFYSQFIGFRLICVVFSNQYSTTKIRFFLVSARINSFIDCSPQAEWTLGVYAFCVVSAGSPKLEWDECNLCRCNVISACELMCVQIDNFF